MPVHHMVYDYDNGWQQAAVVTSPTISVKLSVCQQAYLDLKITPPATRNPGQVAKSAVRRAVTDTGAQMNVIDAQTVKDMGVDTTTLAPTTLRLRGAV